MNYGSIESVWFFGSVSFYVSATAAMLQIVIVLIVANVGRQHTYSLTTFQLVFLIGMSVLSMLAVNLQTGVIQVLANIIGTQGAQQNAIFVSICFIVMLAALIWVINSLGKESQKTIEKCNLKIIITGNLKILLNPYEN